MSHHHWHGGPIAARLTISGHKTLTEVQRYTKDADRQKLADSGMAKLLGQIKNTNVTNIESSLHKHGTNLKRIGGYELRRQGLWKADPVSHPSR